MTEDRTSNRDHRRNPAGAPFSGGSLQSSAAALRADGTPCERSGDLDIDLERVIYDPSYREWVRNELNRTPSDNRTTRRQA
jgi:hypothetical protein